MTDDPTKARRSRLGMFRIPGIGLSLRRSPRWEVKIWFGGRLWFCLLCAWTLLSAGVSMTMGVIRIGTWISDGNWRMLAVLGLVLSVVSWLVTLCFVLFGITERAMDGSSGDEGTDE